jgi:hypothetical protein
VAVVEVGNTVAVVALVDLCIFQVNLYHLPHIIAQLAVAVIKVLQTELEALTA